MKEKYSCNVATRYGVVYITLEKDAIRADKPESGLTFQVSRKQDLPVLEENVFFDLTTKFLLGLYPYVDSAPSRYSYKHAGLIMRQKYDYILNLLSNQWSFDHLLKAPS